MKYLINLVTKEKGFSEVIDSELSTIRDVDISIVMKDKAKAIEKAKRLYINYLIKKLEGKGSGIFKAIKVVPIYTTVLDNTNCKVVDYSNYFIKKS
tara:strand:+ start:754 stop:1041 length:288 start_codon:yes stop_codon:yes gene_type:complete